MSTDKIEELLRNSPSPRPPEDLLRSLQEEIDLSDVQAGTSRRVRIQPEPWLRRWLPALAWSFLIVIGLAAATYQGIQIKEEREQQRQLLQRVHGIAELHLENEVYQALAAQLEELEQIQQQAQEVERLRDEVAQLRDRLAEMERMKTENEELAASIKPVVLPAEERDFFGEMKAEAQIVACVNNLKQIGLALRIYATDNNDFFPASIMQMKNELGTPKILVCPADEDTLQRLAKNWDDFHPSMVGYKLVLSGEKEEFHPQRIISKCMIHENFGLADGSVHREPVSSGHAKIEVIDGRESLVYVDK